jgi:hypothetical protein
LVTVLGSNLIPVQNATATMPVIGNMTGIGFGKKNEEERIWWSQLKRNN